MEVEFRKDIRHNFMVISEENLPHEYYCIRMLENQTLPGVLPIQQRNMDNIMLFYYDITGKQTMQNLYTKASLSYEKLRGLIINIISTMELANEYLLPEDDFILSPDYIYLDVVTNVPYLCFLSGYRKDSKKQISDLLEYLMNKVDYSDKESVLLVYRLYAVSKEAGYTFTHMLEALNQPAKKDATPQIKPVTDQGVQTQERVKYDTDPYRIDRTINNIPVVMEKLEDEKEVSYYPWSTYILSGICALVGLLILILGITSGILYNSYGERLEFGKLIGVLLIVLCAEVYLMRKLWSKENRLTKMVAQSEYIDPRKGYLETSHNKIVRESTIGEKKASAKPQSLIHQVDPSQLTRREYDLWKGNSEIIEDNVDPFQEKPPTSNVEDVTPEDYNPTCLISDTIADTKMTSSILLKSLDEEQYASIKVSEFPFFIGKLRKNVDYCLEKSVVSRYHAKLTKEDNRYYITDLNSTNGTFTNNVLLATYEKKEIIHGDRIALANLGFEFQIN